MVKKVLELNFIHLTVSFKRLSFSERALLCVHTCAHVWVPASAHLFVCRVVFQPPPIILKKIVLVYVTGRKEHLGEVFMPHFVKVEVGQSRELLLARLVMLQRLRILKQHETMSDAPGGSAVTS